MRMAAANRTAVSFDGTILETHARVNLAVGIVHLLIRHHHTLRVFVKGIEILHDELAGAHYAEAGPYLIAELGLDVVEVERELLVALDLVPRKGGDDLLVGGTQHEVNIVAVLEAAELRAVVDPAS